MMRCLIQGKELKPLRHSLPPRSVSTSRWRVDDKTHHRRTEVEMTKITHADATFAVDQMASADDPAAPVRGTGTSC